MGILATRADTQTDVDNGMGFGDGEGGVENEAELAALKNAAVSRQLNGKRHLQLT
jgi:hypothetical protein